jgi:hypothetical protein
MRNDNLIGSAVDNTLDDANDGIDVFVCGLPVANVIAGNSPASP